MRRKKLVVVEDFPCKPTQVGRDERDGHAERHEHAVVAVVAQRVEQPVAGRREQLREEQPVEEEGEGEDAADDEGEGGGFAHGMDAWPCKRAARGAHV